MPYLRRTKRREEQQPQTRGVQQAFAKTTSKSWRDSLTSETRSITLSGRGASDEIPEDSWRVTEHVLETKLTKAIEAIGGEVRKVMWIGRRGAPDRLVMMPGGITVWIEMKAPGKAPDPHQEREHERLRRMGQDVRVVGSYEAVMTFVNEMKGVA